MKIDLHVHSKERSGCANSSDEEMVESAINSGLDALVFTDHNCLVPYNKLEKLNKKYHPFKVFSGIEITVQNEDFLVLGLQDKKLESEFMRYSDLYKYVKRRDGYIALAHPYRFKDSIDVNLKKYTPDAIELNSTRMNDRYNSQVYNLILNIGCDYITNSDAHHYEDIGFYYNDLRYNPENDSELVQILKEGDYFCYNNHLV